MLRTRISNTVNMTVSKMIPSTGLEEKINLGWSKVRHNL